MVIVLVVALCGGNFPPVIVRGRLESDLQSPSLIHIVRFIG